MSGHLPPAHAARRQLGAVDAAHEIRLQGAGDVFCGHVDQLAAKDDAGVVHHHVHAAQLPLDPVEGGVHLRLLGHVAGVLVEPPSLLLWQGLPELLEALGAPRQAHHLEPSGYQ